MTRYHLPIMLASLLVVMPDMAAGEPATERVVLVGKLASWARAGLDAERDAAALRLRSLRRYRRRGRVAWARLARDKGARWIIETMARGRGRRRRARLVLRDQRGRRVASRSLRRATRRKVAAWVKSQLSAPRREVQTAAARQAAVLKAPAWASSAPVTPTTHATPASAPASRSASAVDALLAAEIGDQPVVVVGDGEGRAAPAPAPLARSATLRSTKTGGLPFKLSGAVWAEHMSFLLDRDQQTINSRNEVALQLVLSTRIGSSKRFAHAVVDSLARADLSDDERTEAYFREAYVHAGWGPLSVVAGKRLLDWGVTDGFNPTNTLRLRDLRDPLRPQDRGLFLVHSKLLLGRHLFFESVWAPLFEEPLQPAPSGVDPATGLLASNSRWFTGPDVPLVFIPAESLSDGPESFQYAGRLGLTIEAFDLSLIYSYGYLPLAEFYEIAPGLVQGSFHRRHLVGLDFQTTFGRFALKMEAAASLTEDLDGSKPDVPDSFISYVVQLELSSLRLGRSGHELRLQAQFYADHGLRGEELPQGLLHPFRFLGMGYVEWKYLDQTALAITALYDLPNGLGVRAELWHELVDGLRVELEGLYLDGNNDSFFGVFRRNHQVVGRLKYAF